MAYCVCVCVLEFECSCAQILTRCRHAALVARVNLLSSIQIHKKTLVAHASCILFIIHGFSISALFEKIISAASLKLPHTHTHESIVPHCLECTVRMKSPLFCNIAKFPSQWESREAGFTSSRNKTNKM